MIIGFFDWLTGLFRPDGAADVSGLSPELNARRREYLRTRALRAKQRPGLASLPWMGEGGRFNEHAVFEIGEAMTGKGKYHFAGCGGLAGGIDTRHTDHLDVDVINCKKCLKKLADLQDPANPKVVRCRREQAEFERLIGA